MSTTPQGPRPGRARASRAVTRAILLAAAATTLVAGTAFAGKPGGTTTSALSAPVLVVDVVADGRVGHGDQITFTITSSAAKPYVGVRCYQGASFVYDSYVGYYDGAWFSRTFTLDSTYWAAGSSADCTARLFSYDSRGREKVSATRAFTVAP